VATSAFSLEGKVALITGAGTGIGQAIALGFSDAGAKIVCHYREHIKETVQALDDSDAEYITVQADLAETGKNDCWEIIEKALGSFGQLDILVNNAGTIRVAPALEQSEDDWETVLNANLKSAFFLSQGLANHLIEKSRKGKIINIASLWSFQGGTNVASYTASKSALAGITKALSNEWASKGINVNAIAPGYIKTENTRALWIDEKTSEWLMTRVPAGKWGQPEDVVGMGIFLASTASDYVHGAILPVDGGWLGASILPKRLLVTGSM
jgi:2-deoxy-D-gluconate 3-dehydrogenase